jgi:hypothetical protein
MKRHLKAGKNKFKVIWEIQESFVAVNVQLLQLKDARLNWDTLSTDYGRKPSSPSSP